MCSKIVFAVSVGVFFACEKIRHDEMNIARIIKLYDLSVFHDVEGLKVNDIVSY